MDESPRTPPVGLGVLLVHGMGSAEPGDTLRGVGGPLLDVLGRRPARAAGVQVGNPTAVVLDGDDERPAHVDFDVWPEGRNDAARTWCIAECHWGGTFRPPGYRDVVTWIVLVLPWTVIGYFLTKFEHFTTAPRGPGTGAADRLRRGRDAVLTVAALLGALLLGPLVAALLALVLLLAVPLSRIPIAVLRTPAQAVIRVLSASLGDVYMLASESLDRRAVDQRLQRDLDYLLARCERVAVVAHSAGSYLTHCLLNRAVDAPDPARVPLLVTYGQAVWRVHAVRKLEAGGGRRTIAVVASAGALASGVAAVWLAVTDLPPGWVGAAAVLCLALCGCAFWLVSRAAAAAATTGLGLAAPRRWRDYVASTDPVPNGLMPADLVNEEGRSEPRSYEGVRVHNQRSVLSDHNTYAANQDVFLDSVARDLLRAAGHPEPVGAQAEAQDAWVARRGRTRWLSTARATVLACGAWLLTVAAWSDGSTAADRSRAMTVGTWLVNRLPASWTKSLFGVSASPTDTSSRAKLVGLAAIALALFLLWSGARSLWQSWDRQASRQYLEHRAGGPAAPRIRSRARFVAAWLALLVVLSGVTVLLQYVVPSRVSTAAWEWQRLDDGWFWGVSGAVVVACAVASGYTLWPARTRQDREVTSNWDAARSASPTSVPSAVPTDQHDPHAGRPC